MRGQKLAIFTVISLLFLSCSQLLHQFLRSFTFNLLLLSASLSPAPHFGVCSNCLEYLNTLSLLTLKHLALYTKQRFVLQTCLLTIPSLLFDKPLSLLFSFWRLFRRQNKKKHRSFSRTSLCSIALTVLTLAWQWRKPIWLDCFSSYRWQKL